MALAEAVPELSLYEKQCIEHQAYEMLLEHTTHYGIYLPKGFKVPKVPVAGISKQANDEMLLEHTTHYGIYLPKGFKVPKVPVAGISKQANDEMLERLVQRLYHHLYSTATKDRRNHVNLFMRQHRNRQIRMGWLIRILIGQDPYKGYNPIVCDDTRNDVWWNAPREDMPVPSNLDHLPPMPDAEFLKALQKQQPPKEWAPDPREPSFIQQHQQSLLLDPPEEMPLVTPLTASMVTQQLPLTDFDAMYS